MTDGKPLNPDKFGKCFDCSEEAVHLGELKAAIVHYHKHDVLIVQARIGNRIGDDVFNELRFWNLKDSFKGVM